MSATTSPGYLPRAELQTLLDVLEQRGYRCIGPRVRDGAIVYEDLTVAEALPRGVRQTQAPGSYRLQEHDDARCFAWANGPQALKPHLFATREVLWQVTRDDAGRLHFESHVPTPQPLAVLGVRACDLAALAIHDAHFLQRAQDAFYAARRADLFLIAVHCTHPAGTCFCASTGDGPRAVQGFDLALGELDEGFVVEAGSGAGEQVLGQLPLQPLPSGAQDEIDRAMERAAASQSRALPQVDLSRRLFANLEHPRWQDVAGRCLSCGNCTSVCPTCFCHREFDEAALSGKGSEHLRDWDSCFTAGHSFLAGRPLRSDTRLRYRQWLTHKHGSWHQQYGRSGCVGCGRCITWCPTGIDIVEELWAICT